MRYRTNWPAIWSGMFVFLAVESTFGLLGAWIFGDSHFPGFGWGLGIWMIVLTIVALGVGARATAHHAEPVDSVDGAWHGLAMFGLSILASVVILMGVNHTVASADVLAYVKDNVGWLFIAFLLGGVSASLSGRPMATQTARVRLDEPGTIRPAA